MRRVVLGNLGVRGDELLVRGDVGVLGKDGVSIHALVLGVPEREALQVGNGERIAHNVARAVLGKCRVDASEPALDLVAVQDLRALLSLLGGVLLGPHRAEQRKDVLEIGQELLDLQRSNSIPGEQAAQLAGVDEDGIALRELVAVDVKHGELAVLEATGGL